MLDDLEIKAYELSKKFRKISPMFLMRKFKLTFIAAQEICRRVWLRNNREAREEASKLEFFGWPAQLDACRKKNLNKFKRTPM